MNIRSQLAQISGFAFAALVVSASPAPAASITLSGNTNGSLATATEVSSFNSATNVFTFTLTNTSPFDARITGVGFDLLAGDFTANGSSGLNGFSGANNGSFTFTDAALGSNVPQFSDTVLDFGWLTGSNFGGGNPPSGVAPGNSISFSVTGPFTGYTDSQIASSIFVRFQRVGADGEGSDVSRPLNSTPVPEPATLTLLGGGLISLASAARRRRKSASR